MLEPESGFEWILGIESLGDLHPVVAVNVLSKTIDKARDARRADVLEHIVQSLVPTVPEPKLSALEACVFEYCVSNAWSLLRSFRSPHPGGSWDWDCKYLEQEIVWGRRAANRLAHLDGSDAPACSIHTNLGNCYSSIGRFVDASHEWSRALDLSPTFGMARGNRAVGLWFYATHLYDDGHAVFLAREAWQGLDPATLEDVEPAAAGYFAEIRRVISERVPAELLRKELNCDGYLLGETDREVQYRRWCLGHRFFLNPLNDATTESIAAADVFTCPSTVVGIDEGPIYHDFFNQMKQEYCSARWLIFDSEARTEAHCSDRGVLLYDTLDYPWYGLAAECVKLAYRSLYSLFDKIAFFANAYFRLSIPEKRVSFRGLWYVGQDKRKGLRNELRCYKNLPLRALYWLAKDIYEDGEGFRNAIDPAARRFCEVRNHLEHKFLKLHEHPWDPSVPSVFAPGLATSLCREEFLKMAYYLLRTTRAALMYLSLSIQVEEAHRYAARGPDVITPPCPLESWDDEMKR